MNNFFSLETIGSIVVSIFTYLIGGIDSLFTTLLILIVIDYITGLCKGIYRKEVSSKKSIKGIIKKFGYLCILIIAVLMDYLMNKESMAIRTLMLYFFIANEGLSILENWALMGLPLPKKLFAIFEKLKGDEIAK